MIPKRSSKQLPYQHPVRKGLSPRYYVWKQQLWNDKTLTRHQRLESSSSTRGSTNRSFWPSLMAAKASKRSRKHLFRPKSNQDTIKLLQTSSKLLQALNRPLTRQTKSTNPTKKTYIEKESHSQSKRPPRSSTKMKRTYWRSLHNKQTLSLKQEISSLR